MSLGVLQTTFTNYSHVLFPDCRCNVSIKLLVTMLPGKDGIYSPKLQSVYSLSFLSYLVTTVRKVPRTEIVPHSVTCYLALAGHALMRISTQALGCCNCRCVPPRLALTVLVISQFTFYYYNKGHDTNTFNNNLT